MKIRFFADYGTLNRLLCALQSELSTFMEICSTQKNTHLLIAAREYLGVELLDYLENEKWV